MGGRHHKSFDGHVITVPRTKRGAAASGRREASTQRREGWIASRKKELVKLAVVLLATVAVIRNEILSPLLYQTLRGNTRYAPSSDSIYIAREIYVPGSLDADSARRLSNSLNLGGGNCQWKPPTYEVPEELDFQKTFVAGYPSGDKRMAFLQMEALAGFGAKDEWDFAYMGMSNHPFIKGNYPHHEGIWGWGAAADQTILMVPNIRRAMLEYHDIIWDLGYSTTWEDSTIRSDNLFKEKPDFDEYYEWRDARVMDEIRWYGWHIDYWMEGGLLRDIFTHKLITKEHWDDLKRKFAHQQEELDYDNYVSNSTGPISPAYDAHCAQGEITNGCEPVAIISADKLKDYAEGPAETARIAETLMNDARTGQYVIAQEAWDCIWKELIQKKKGPSVMTDRPGYENLYEGYNFSVEMLLEMIDELNRLITKYGSGEWNTKETANRLVEILVEHRGLVEAELEEINTGARKLTRKDFLGPQERAKRRKLKPQDKAISESKRKARFKYLTALEQKLHDDKHREMRKLARMREEQANKHSTKVVSDRDLLKALSGALKQISTLKVAGSLNEETALRLVRRIRTVASEAKVGLAKSSE
eukprot:CAMPEP_0172548244 /NCGR_PEP_ID=MMETSP1067-20121228/17578_1 /TAXON_ID=265564 ORGANISM="Thalassiosira punctigera, Strain Tpunct2005C2" /NCGR_SAMPLE_ID=MMETSP1067 /ASSEMBLY_ACC=CAM_ASM_000444 /LENGTH=588 /DNA_ID=CAMNT_0013335439 /DNA_START=104 /DNA_END=1870 /DNA_ORIENTATION=+